MKDVVGEFWTRTISPDFTHDALAWRAVRVINDTVMAVAKIPFFIFGLLLMIARGIGFPLDRSDKAFL
jgi:hypothetical protein